MLTSLRLVAECSVGLAALNLNFIYIKHVITEGATEQTNVCQNTIREGLASTQKPTGSGCSALQGRLVTPSAALRPQFLKQRVEFCC